MNSVKLVVVLIVATILQEEVLAHSWLECADFRPSANGVWKDGQCAGRPRNWGKNRDDIDKPYDCYREFRQDQNRGIVCNPNREGRGSPISSSYSADQPMTVVKSGQKLCWRWPAKNHDDDKGYMRPNNRLADHPVFVNWAPSPSSTTDPSQDELDKGRIVGLDYEYCDPPVGGDTDKQPCGGCFYVPEKEPGTYLVQWWWEFNPGEIYISCADIEVQAGGSKPPAPTYPAGYLGCYEGAVGNGKTLAEKGFTWPDNKGNNNSPASCVASCKAAGFAYAGLLFSTDCWCGNTEPSVNTRSAKGLVDCSMQCTGDVNKQCGGNTAASIYSTTVENAGNTGGVVDPGYVDGGDSNTEGGGGGLSPGGSAALAIFFIALAAGLAGGAFWYYRKNNNSFPILDKFKSSSSSSYSDSRRTGDYVRA